MDLGIRLQVCRKAKKVTQAEMAVACGLSKNYVLAMERRVNKCSAQTIISYANKLDMSLDGLVGRQPQNDNDILPELKRIL